MPRFLAHLPSRLFLLAMAAGSALITATSLAYFDFDTLPPFVIEKLPVRFEHLWLASLRIHVASAAVAFPLCLALMTRALQKRPRWHARLGRFTGGVVLLLLVPTGAVLAFDAKGGAVATAGFLLSGALVAWGMASGALAARRRDFVAHRRGVHHVVLQMSVAVTSRAMILGLDALGVDPDRAYLIALWAPVLASAAVAELVSSPSALAFVRSKLFERIRRELSPLVRSFRVRSLDPHVARVGR